jgi:hypothetical protein
MQVFVAGATGAIGRRLVPQLVTHTLDWRPAWESWGDGFQDGLAGGVGPDRAGRVEP